MRRRLGKSRRPTWKRYTNLLRDSNAGKPPLARLGNSQLSHRNSQITLSKFAVSASGHSRALLKIDRLLGALGVIKPRAAGISEKVRSYLRDAVYRRNWSPRHGLCKGAEIGGSGVETGRKQRLQKRPKTALGRLCEKCHSPKSPN